MKIIISVLVILVFSLGGFYLWVITSNNTAVPQRFDNIPKEAVWRGAADEGFWVQIINVDSIKRVIGVNIFNDYNGELFLEADFTLQSNCYISPFSIENIYANIIGIENRNTIMLKNNCNFFIDEPANDSVIKSR